MLEFLYQRPQSSPDSESVTQIIVPAIGSPKLVSFAKVAILKLERLMFFVSDVAFDALNFDVCSYTRNT